MFECFISLEEMKRLHQSVGKKVKVPGDNVRFYWIPSDALPRTLTLGSTVPESPPEFYII